MMVEQLEQAVFPNAGYIVLAAGHRARELDELARHKLYAENDEPTAYSLQQEKIGLVINCAKQLHAFSQQGGYVSPEGLAVVDAIAGSAQAALEDDDYYAMGAFLKPRGSRRSDPNHLELAAVLHFDTSERERPFTLQMATQVATAAHLGMVDHGDGRPYINHPLRIMRALELYGHDVQMIAVLHDTVEDCPWVTLQLLRELGASGPIIKGVDAVTKREGEGYHNGLIRRAKRSTRGKLVKLADNLDNSNEARLANFPPEDAERRRQKYAVARDILLKGDAWLAQQAEPIKAAVEAHYIAEAA